MYKIVLFWGGGGGGVFYSLNTAYLANDIRIGESDNHTVLWGIVFILVLSH